MKSRCQCYPLGMAKPTLYLMLGYPGAGKTTTAEFVAELTGAVHLASDKIRLALFPKPKFTPEEHNLVYITLNKRTVQLLKQGKSVIYDANLNKYAYRAEKYAICRKVDAKSVVLWLTTEKNEAKKRTIQNDKNRRPFMRDVETFERIAREIEPPRVNEEVIKIDGKHITKESVQAALFEL